VLTIKGTQMDYAARAAASFEKGRRIYGLPSSGPVYDGNVQHLVGWNVHDFRLAEMPKYVGDPAYLQQQKKILDLGCGPATMVYRALGFGHDAYGIDLDADRIDLAHFRVDAEGLSRSWRDHVTVADATKLPFPDETFDVVSSWQVLEHVEDLSAVLFEAVRVTKRGGWLDLRAPDYRQCFDNHYAMSWPRFMPREQAVRWAVAMGRPADGVGTFFYITMPQIITLLEALGCRIAAAELYQHVNGVKQPFNGTLGADALLFSAQADIEGIAREVQRLEREGTLPPSYRWPLEFVIYAQRTK
jgi:ubiquinone/menaquinone biosynthesis C-methylase UbiE